MQFKCYKGVILFRESNKMEQGYWEQNIKASINHSFPHIHKIMGNFTKL